MLAIIKDENNKKYVSKVFAIKWKGWDSEVIVFNQDFTHIKILDMWKPKRQVFIVDYENFDCENDDWEGLDWIIHDKEFMKVLTNKKSVPVENYLQLKEYAKEIKLPEWFEIKTQKDCDSLMEVSFGGFHDSQPVRAEQNGNNLELELDTTWGCHITLKFIDIIDMDIIERFGLIYESEMKIENDCIVWNVTGWQDGWIDSFTDEDNNNEPFVKCKKLLWKIDVD